MADLMVGTTHPATNTKDSDSCPLDSDALCSQDLPHNMHNGASTADLPQNGLLGSPQSAIDDGDGERSVSPLAVDGKSERECDSTKTATTTTTIPVAPMETDSERAVNDDSANGLTNGNGCKTPSPSAVMESSEEISQPNNQLPPSNDLKRPLDSLDEDEANDKPQPLNSGNFVVSGGTGKRRRTISGQEVPEVAKTTQEDIIPSKSPVPIELDVEEKDIEVNEPEKDSVSLLMEDPKSADAKIESLENAKKENLEPLGKIVPEPECQNGPVRQDDEQTVVDRKTEDEADERHATKENGVLDESVENKLVEAEATVETSVADGDSNDNSDLKLVIDDDEEDVHEVSHEGSKSDSEDLLSKTMQSDSSLLVLQLSSESEERDASEDLTLAEDELGDTPASEPLEANEEIRKDDNTPVEDKTEDITAVHAIDAPKSLNVEENLQETSESEKVGTPDVESGNATDENSQPSIFETPTTTVEPHVGTAEGSVPTDENPNSDDNCNPNSDIPDVNPEPDILDVDTNSGDKLNSESESSELKPESDTVDANTNSDKKLSLGNESSETKPESENVEVNREPEQPLVDVNDQNDVEMTDNEAKPASDVPEVKTDSPVSKPHCPVEEAIPGPSSEQDSGTAMSKALTKFKKSFKDFTREDLESLIMSKMMEAILFKSKSAENANLIVSQGQQISVLRSKLDECQRQFKIIEAMFKNTTAMVRMHEKKGCRVIPKSMTRTVSIQTWHQPHCKSCGNNFPLGFSKADAPVGVQQLSVMEPPENKKVPVQAAAPPPLRPVVVPEPPKPAVALPEPVTLPKPVPSGSKVILKPARPNFNVNTSKSSTGTIPNGSRATAPPVAQQPMVVDLTDDDDGYVQKPASIPDKRHSLPQTKATPVGQQRTATAINQYGIVKTNVANSQAPAIRSSLPAPIPTGQNNKRASVDNVVQTKAAQLKHPAPLPPFLLNVSVVNNRSYPKLPPLVPKVQVRCSNGGIILTWTMDATMHSRYAEMKDYQLYGYKITDDPPSSQNWTSLGHVKAMKLPMAVTLTQFHKGQRYFFCVRARDIHNRYGSFSNPVTW